jgi:hypothetical protein
MTSPDKSGITVGTRSYTTLWDMIHAGWPTYCGCGSVFSWFGGGTTWLEYPL